MSSEQPAPPEGHLPRFDPDTGALPPGDYHPTKADFEARFVDIASATRQAIYTGATAHAEALAAAGVALDAPCLLNGSYTTNKVDPGDLDLVVEVDEQLFESSERVQELLAGPNVKATYSCDAYPILVLPDNHPDYLATTVKAREYWHNFFALDRQRRPKGRVWRSVGGFR